MDLQQQADLHTHSSYSDGTLSPEALVSRASRFHLGALALTDHDTTAGLAEAQETADRLGVRLIPGIEIAADHKGSDRHILGYWIDPSAEELSSLLQRLATERRERIHRIVQKLESCCSVELDPQEVFALSHQGVTGRLHVAEALRRRGVTSSIQEAFNRFLRDGGPAYVGRFTLPVGETIALIHRTGGVAVLAHPGDPADEEELAAFSAAGLDGIEAFYPTHPPAVVQQYVALARGLNLIATGGSDYHGERTLPELGSVTVPLEIVDSLNQRRNDRNATARNSR
jgi:predicted metal-dependent phosphoesterase TrpH